MSRTRGHPLVAEAAPARTSGTSPAQSRTAAAERLGLTPSCRFAVDQAPSRRRSACAVDPGVRAACWRRSGRRRAPAAAQVSLAPAPAAPVAGGQRSRRAGSGAGAPAACASRGEPRSGALQSRSARALRARWPPLPRRRRAARRVVVRAGTRRRVVPLRLSWSERRPAGNRDGRARSRRRAAVSIQRDRPGAARVVRGFGLAAPARAGQRASSRAGRLKPCAPAARGRFAMRVAPAAGGRARRRSSCAPGSGGSPSPFVVDGGRRRRSAPRPSPEPVARAAGRQRRRPAARRIRARHPHAHADAGTRPPPPPRRPPRSPPPGTSRARPGRRHGDERAGRPRSRPAGRRRPGRGAAARRQPVRERRAGRLPARRTAPPGGAWTHRASRRSATASTAWATRTATSPTSARAPARRRAATTPSTSAAGT